MLIAINMVYGKKKYKNKLFTNKKIKNIIIKD